MKNNATLAGIQVHTGNSGPRLVLTQTPLKVHKIFKSSNPYKLLDIVSVGETN